MSILKDSSFLVGSNVILLVSSLASGILTARLLGPTGKGELYLVLQIASLGSLVLSAGLGPSYQYHLSKKIFDRPLIVSHMMVQTVLVIFAVVMLGVFGTQILFKITGHSISEFLLILTGIAVVINIELLFAGSILMSLPQGVKISSILGIWSSVINVLLLSIFLWLLKLGVTGAILAYLISLIVRLIPIMHITTKDVCRELRFEWFKPSKLLFSFGGSAFLANVMVSSVFRVDVFIVNALVGVESVGVYSVAVALAELALLVPNALGTSLFTHLPFSTNEEQIVILGRSSRIIIAIAIITGIMLAAMSYPLVIVLMGNRFIDAVAPLCLLIPGLVAMSVNFVYANYYAASGRPLIGAACFGLGLIINIVVNYAIIPLYGIKGAAVASSISYGFVTSVFVMLLKRQHGLSLRSLLFLTRSDIAEITYKINILRGRFNIQPSYPKV